MTWWAQVEAAVAMEWLKVRRARVPWTAGVLLVGGVLAITLAARQAAAVGAGAAGQKARLLLQAGGVYPWGPATQVAAVASLVAFGVAFGWLHGREYEEGRLDALYARPVARWAIAVAKLVVQVVWVVVAAVGLVVATGVLAWADGRPIATDIGLAARLLAVLGLNGCLAAVCAFAAAAVRSTLAALAAAVLLVAVAQVAVLLGVGGWLPVSAPGLWAAQAAPVIAPELALGLVGAVVFGAASSAGTVAAWATRDIA